MRLLCCALMLLCMASCKKDNGISTLRDDMEGSWELRSRSSLSGQFNYAPGNGEILKFYRNGNYERKAHDTIIGSGQYTISVKNDCFDRESNSVLDISESSSGLPAYISIRSDTLFFNSSNCLADGMDSYYQRL